MLSKQAPNISLNVQGAIPSKSELILWTTLGVVLQFVAFVVPALTTYHWKWKKGANSVQEYAYPCFLTGSCLLTIGIILCSHVIEGMTVERTFVPLDTKDEKLPIRVLRLQMPCTIGDQHFPACITWNSAEPRMVRTSRLSQSSRKPGYFHMNLRYGLLSDLYTP